MPVHSVHQDYKNAIPKWKRVRDAMAGTDAVHMAGEQYIPRLAGQTDLEYIAMIRRAGWYGASARTVDSMHGLVFRKPPVIRGPEEMLNDLTLTGKSAYDVASDIVRQVLEVGRVGVLVDHAVADDVGPINLAQAKQLGLRPYVSIYQAENIINWRQARINGSMQLTMVVLSEQYEDDSPGDDGTPDPFVVEMEQQYRVLWLRDGVYVQEIWRENDEGDWYPHSTNIPLMNGKPMDSIPFFIITTEAIGPDVADPPFLDLVDLNLSHYLTTCNLENGAHFTGLPQAYISGYQKVDQAEVLTIGSSSAWIFPDPNTKVGYLEFHGEGLKTLESRLDRKESQMAKLGARLLTDTRNSSHAESAKALEMKTSAETSVLGGIAVTVARAVTKVLEIASSWMGTGEEAVCELNTDYIIAGMDPQKILALIALYQSGGIGIETLFENLKNGEVIADSKTFEQELQEIKAATAMRLADQQKQAGIGTDPMRIQKLPSDTGVQTGSDREE